MSVLRYFGKPSAPTAAAASPSSNDCKPVVSPQTPPSLSSVALSSSSSDAAAPVPTAAAVPSTEYCVARFHVAQSKVPIDWLGVMRVCDANALLATAPSAPGVLDFYTATSYASLRDVAISPLGQALQRHFRVVFRGAAEVDNFRTLLRQLGQPCLGTVDFPAALRGAHSQENEERREKRRTKQFKRKVAEAESRGEVYDDGVPGSVALGSEDSNTSDEEDDDADTHKDKRSRYVDVSDDDDDQPIFPARAADAAPAMVDDGGDTDAALPPTHNDVD